MFSRYLVLSTFSLGTDSNNLLFSEIRLWGINLSAWILGKPTDSAYNLFLSLHHTDKDERDSEERCHWKMWATGPCSRLDKREHFFQWRFGRIWQNLKYAYPSNWAMTFRNHVTETSGTLSRRGNARMGPGLGLVHVYTLYYINISEPSTDFKNYILKNNSTSQQPKTL